MAYALSPCLPSSFSIPVFLAFPAGLWVLTSFLLSPVFSSPPLSCMISSKGSSPLHGSMSGVSEGFFLRCFRSWRSPLLWGPTCLMEAHLINLARASQPQRFSTQISFSAVNQGILQLRRCKSHCCIPGRLLLRSSFTSSFLWLWCLSRSILKADTCSGF